MSERRTLVSELERQVRKRQRDHDAEIKAKTLFWHGVGLAVANGVILFLRRRARHG